MRIRLKSASISLESHETFQRLEEQIKVLFFDLDTWLAEHQGLPVGVMQSLTFPKTNNLSDTSKVNQLISLEYKNRSWPVIGGDTSHGPNLVISVTLIYQEHYDKQARLPSVNQLNSV